MYCPKIKKTSRELYVVPLSPRLKGTIFSMSKNKLLIYCLNESEFIQDFIKNIDENQTLLNIYKNLSNLDLTIARRVKIKLWLENHGAEFYALNILPNSSWKRILGKGSFSTVHLLDDRYNHDCKRALKIGIAKKMNIKLFEREMSILKSINHPYIIKLYNFGMDCCINNNVDVGTVNCTFWSLNDYCNSGSLDAYIKNMHQISFYVRNKFISHILQALSYIHNKNIIHRDIKPANIFIHNMDIDTDNIIFKLGDFNLSREIDHTNLSTLSYCGTPSYMAPEILKRESYSEKADLWSFLCVLIEIILLDHCNPILKTTDNLLEILNLSCTNYELGLIKLLHYTDPQERNDTNSLISYMTQNEPLLSLRRTRSKSI
tara:strand:- start:4055 stop:5179 length:1125 start_codon:yes stop_codon:yes gene_type:complete